MFGLPASCSTHFFHCWYISAQKIYHAMSVKESTCIGKSNTWLTFSLKGWTRISKGTLHFTPPASVTSKLSEGGLLVHPRRASNGDWYIVPGFPIPFPRSKPDQCLRRLPGLSDQYGGTMELWPRTRLRAPYTSSPNLASL